MPDVHDTNRLLGILKLAPLFASLNPEQMRLCARQAQVRSVANGAVLLRQGTAANTLYVIVSGRFRVSELTADGREVVYRYPGPGDMLGGMAAVGDMAYPITAIAAAQSQVLAFSGTVVQRLMEMYPAMARNAMRLMVKRIEELQQRCVELATQRVQQRIARAIVRLSAQTGKRVAEGVLLDVTLTRQDIAEMTGTTLFTVSRLLNQWQADGLVKIGRRKVTLAKPHELMRIAEELPDSF